MSKYIFREAVAFEHANLIKLAPALQSSAVHIGVWPDDKDKLAIWGFTDNHTNPSLPLPQGGSLMLSSAYPFAFMCMNQARLWSS